MHKLEEEFIEMWIDVDDWETAKKHFNQIKEQIKEEDDFFKETLGLD